MSCRIAFSLIREKSGEYDGIVTAMVPFQCSLAQARAWSLV